MLHQATIEIFSLHNVVKSRFLEGTLNGNISVMKSMLAEMTDASNMARAISTIPFAWAVGATIGYASLLHDDQMGIVMSA
jgi:hypothetical protein